MGNLTMTEKILEEVKQERKRQDKKWGEQNKNGPTWLCIIMEEVGEVAKAILVGKEEFYRYEMIQVAASAVAAIECFDRNIS